MSTRRAHPRRRDMTPGRAVMIAAVVSFGVTTTSTLPVAHAATSPPSLAAHSDSDTVDIYADAVEIGARPDDAPGDDTEYRRAVWEPSDCVLLAGADPTLDAWCAGPQDIDLYEIHCPPGTMFTWPLKIRTRPAGTTTWGPWRLLNPPCVPRPNDGEATSTDPIAAELSRQIATLKIPPRHARLDPVTDWFAVQIPMTFFTDTGPQQLTTTVLDTPVELELTPTDYSWDPGDGTTPIRTTRPGAPYPDQTTTHVYTRKGTYQVTLTTTWAGRSRITGTTRWHPITGTGTTTHTSDPFTTREIRSALS